ncbi:ricin-type beta-trefoil lectin domain protein [Dactylosporangium sp. NPDC050588]|uniref:ricin-type beta-trefoil lectin domain protein n=1 Tax=Dactylosporangium sp. NPDC050588 TaxID=3157211 RepID=UPI00340790A2
MSRRRIGLAIGATVLAVTGTTVVAMTTASAAATGQITGYGGKCVDVAAASSANGTQVQLYTCNGTGAQQWTVGDDGTIRALGKCLDVNAASNANGTKIQIWDCNGTTAQQWSKQSDGTLRSLGKCLDATGPSSADGTKLQLWDCFASANQQWTLPGGTTNPPTSTPPNNPNNPDLGPNVSVFDSSMSQATIQNRLNTVFNQQVTNQFGDARFALLFKPGTYNVNANVGFFTQVAGLGLSPDSVVINGAVHAEADWWPDGSQNATQNFWRSAENLSVTPTGGLDRWAVSQAAPYRRMHVRGNLALSDGGWSSGGWISDSKIDGQIQSGSQQQWITRNSQIGSWSGSNWNQVFVGTAGAPGNSFPNPPYTTVGAAPVVREKPFLYVDSAGAYQVFVPSLRTNASGNSWSSGSTAGSSLPISQFYIVKAGATAASINAALANGQNLLFTPGVYHVNDTIRITRANTVVLGLGLATIVPDNGVTAMTVADVDGVKVAGVLFDAGTTNSQVLMEVGPNGSTADHSANPTSLHDVFFRVGGSIAGKATVSLRVNSNNVIGDHMWIWRADHGNGGTVGWNINTGANGLVVNGNNVTMYGLFVEHYQQYQTIWNGNGGRTYFYQNEIPYDVPNQSSWSSGGGAQGWAAYKVGANVTSHEAWGLGSYCFFSTNPSVVLGHSFEVPQTGGVKFHNMVTVSLGGTGTIAHIINNTGGPSNSSTNVANWVNYP